MRKRISMPDRDFMKAAKSAAKSGQSLRATALGAGVSLQTYKNHLIDVAMRLQEAPPNFPKGRRTRMKEHISEVRSSGQEVRVEDWLCPMKFSRSWVGMLG